jgi:hypothetical protein
VLVAGEYAVPLLLVTLIVLTIASWRVVQPPLALALSVVVAASAISYLSLSVIPRFRAAPELRDVASAPFEATAYDARSNELAIQIYRGPKLVGSCELHRDEAAPKPPAGPLRLERRATGQGFEVWSGATRVGSLPESSLAAFVQPVESSSHVERAGAPPELFLTPKVVVGGSFSLGSLPQAGPVSVQFVRLDELGRAIVRVDGSGLGPASPATLELTNKSVRTQSFGSIDFDVAIREASFVADPPWAAFAVITHR